jgi:hypothetical protein
MPHGLAECKASGRVVRELRSATAENAAGRIG